MASILTNRSFARGAVSPYLFARPEIEDFPYSARILDNFMITKEAVAQSRPGTNYVDECRSPSTEKRLIPFIFSTSAGDTYVLEFGDEYMEVVRAGGRVLETAVNISAATATSPCVITTSSAHGYSAGDHVYITGVSGMTQLNGRRYEVQTPSTTQLSLYNTSSSAVDAEDFTAYTSGGTVAKVYKITTPYQEADLDDLRFTQSADVMYIVHPDYEPRKLSRTGHTSWTLSTVTFGPSTDGPSAVAVTAGGSGAGLTYKYKVTSIPANGTESLPGYEAGISISGATAANPVVITSATHSYSDGDEVYISGVSGMTELNGRRFIIDVLTTTTFSLLGVDGTSYTAYTSGGTSYRTHDEITNANAPTTAAPHVITWTAVSGVTRYAIYREQYGFYGFIGYSDSTTFSDPNITPDTSQGPPEYQEEFFGADNYPAAVTIHQQRVVYGGSDNEPDTVKASQIGGYDDFSTHNPLADSDAVEFTLASTEINRIVHLVSLRRLVVLTGSSEWAVEGNDAGTLIPTAINARPYTIHGASKVRPAVVDNDILYVQARGSVIRSLYYDFSRDSYISQDVTLKASHFFRGYSVRDMAYAKIPNSILWVVRSDGKLLSLTYNPEVKILAWTGHTVGGSFSTGDPVVEQVATIPENDSAVTGGEDAVYIITKRTVDSRTVRYIERLKERVIDQDVRDDYTWLAPDHQEEFCSLDSFLTYDERNTGSSTMTLSGASYNADDEVTLTCSASNTFLSTDVGEDSTSRKFYLWDSTGELIRCTVTEYTSDTVVTVRVHADVPATLQATATTRWAPAVRRVTGLWHLEGEDVSAFGDGFVAANAYTDDTAVTVSDGAAVFSEFYTVLHVGLPYKCDLEFHDIEFPEGTLYSRRKMVVAVGAYVKDSQTFYAGEAFPDEDDGEDVDENLYRAEERDLDEEDADLPIPLRTEFIQVNLPGGSFTDHGRAIIRHLEPRPLTLLAGARVFRVEGQE